MSQTRWVFWDVGGIVASCEFSKNKTANWATGYSRSAVEGSCVGCEKYHCLYFIMWTSMCKKCNLFTLLTVTVSHSSFSSPLDSVPHSTESAQTENKSKQSSAITHPESIRGVSPELRHYTWLLLSPVLQLKATALCGEKKQKNILSMSFLK